MFSEGLILLSCAWPVTEHCVVLDQGCFLPRLPYWAVCVLGLPVNLARTVSEPHCSPCPSYRTLFHSPSPFPGIGLKLQIGGFPGLLLLPLPLSVISPQ
jgi:hypothetical protein